MGTGGRITEKIKIVMYRWAGQKFGLVIKSGCMECDINTGILKDMLRKEFFGEPVEIKIKPWLTFVWESLRAGGWHAPVVTVNGKLFSQGVIIDRDLLAKVVKNEILKQKERKNGKK